MPMELLAGDGLPILSQLLDDRVEISHQFHMQPVRPLCLTNSLEAPKEEDRLRLFPHLPS